MEEFVTAPIGGNLENHSLVVRSAELCHPIQHSALKQERTGSGGSIGAAKLVENGEPAAVDADLVNHALVTVSAVVRHTVEHAAVQNRPALRTGAIGGSASELMKMGVPAAVYAHRVNHALVAVPAVFSHPVEH